MRLLVAQPYQVFKNIRLARGGRVLQTDESEIAQLLDRNEAAILQDWIRLQLADVRRSHLINDAEVQQQSREFLALLRNATQTGQLRDVQSREWDTVRRMLEDLSRKRAAQGFSPSETATFVFSLKETLFARIRQEYAAEPERLATLTWGLSSLLDRLGLYTTEVFQKGREDVISRQQQEMLELSTPVVTLWDGVLALPVIGTLDSARTQIVMENLLQRIVDTGAAIAIIDITGVPTVDTLVAQHLLKTVSAARLMGADCIISGIRPQIAQTIVHLGVDLQDVITKATLQDAFAIALRRLNLSIQKDDGKAKSRAGRASADVEEQA
jgi:rsbT co-antagonist protein RsbR